MKRKQSPILPPPIGEQKKIRARRDKMGHFGTFAFPDHGTRQSPLPLSPARGTPLAITHIVLQLDSTTTGQLLRFSSAAAPVGSSQNSGIQLLTREGRTSGAVLRRLRSSASSKLLCTSRRVPEARVRYSAKLRPEAVPPANSLGPTSRAPRTSPGQPCAPAAEPRVIFE